MLLVRLQPDSHLKIIVELVGQVPKGNISFLIKIKYSSSNNNDNS